MDILGLKNIAPKIKKLLDGFNSRLDKTEDRIIEIKDKSVEKYPN